MRNKTNEIFDFYVNGFKNNTTFFIENHQIKNTTYEDIDKINELFFH